MFVLFFVLKLNEMLEVFDFFDLSFVSENFV